MEIGLAARRIILSAKVSAVQDLIAVYRSSRARSRLCPASRPDRGGHGLEGHRRLGRRAGVLLQAGIGDTIRISLTPEPGGDRTTEVKVAQELLQTMGFRTFVPLVAACPGCGRTTSTVFQELAQDIQDFIRDVHAGVERRYPGVETLTCGDGLHRQRARANRSMPISASRCPAPARQPAAPVFIDGRKAATLRGPTLAADFKAMVVDYIERRFGPERPRSRRGGRRGEMRKGFLALIALLIASTAALAEDVAPEEEADVDSWIGCWSRVYDAVHLCQAPGAEGRSDDALCCAARRAKATARPAPTAPTSTALVRDKQDTFANPENAPRRVEQGATLSCFTDGFFIGQFSIERAGKNRKLALRGAGQNLALVPGVDLGAFIVPCRRKMQENALFLLQAAPAKILRAVNFVRLQPCTSCAVPARVDATEDDREPRREHVRHRRRCRSRVGCRRLRARRCP